MVVEFIYPVIYGKIKVSIKSEIYDKNRFTTFIDYTGFSNIWENKSINKQIVIATLHTMATTNKTCWLK